MSSRSRQDELIRLLRRRGSITVAQLVDAIGVSRRTILRDLASLRDEGFVIHTSAGPGGGVYLDPTSFLVTAKLSVSEVFALLISVAVLKQTHAIPFAHLADRGLEKIEQSLPRDRVTELREILRNVYIGPAATEDILATLEPIESSVLSVFETGFLNSKRIGFRYIDRRGVKSKRAVDAHAMLVLSPAWYLVGFDPDRKAFRHFRMDRIVNAQIEDTTFQRRSFTINEAECPFRVFT